MQYCCFLLLGQDQLSFPATCDLGQQRQQQVCLSPQAIDLNALACRAQGWQAPTAGYTLLRTKYQGVILVNKSNLKCEIMLQININ